MYQEADPIGDPLPAEYNLQFLWHALTSDFDVIGPYFSSAVSYDHSFVIASVTETMRLMHLCDFLIVGLVCDGTSTSVAAIRLMCQQKRGAFGTNLTLDDKHQVNAWFTNYFTPELNAYCCICPSHQLKKHDQCTLPVPRTKLFKIQEIYHTSDGVKSKISIAVKKSAWIMDNWDQFLGCWVVTLNKSICFPSPNSCK